MRAAAIVVCELIALVYNPVAHAEVCYQDAGGHIVARRRPGLHQVECPRKEAAAPAAPTAGAAPVERTSAASRVPLIVRSTNPVSPVPRPGPDDYVAAVPVPDRWRIVDALGNRDRWWDPYNRNIFKADKPVHDDWFFNVAVMSDNVIEVRDVPTPVGISSTQSPGDIDVFGGDDQWTAIENVAVEFVYYEGDTTFKPPEYEFRFTPVFNVNYTRLEEIGGVDADPREGRARTDGFVGIQQAFVDKHLRNVSDQFDFDSIRVGIQPFSTDFRGFLFQDNQLGVRLFGNRHNNRLQYNVAWFRRIEKDTNSGLNDLSQALRDDDIFVANLYWQDLPLPGFTSQAIVAYNRNHENHGTHYDDNGFIQRPASIGEERPRSYDAGYVGYNGDGHFGRLNLTTSLYFAFGQENGSVFVAENTDIRAMFAAAEASMDFDWIRAKVSFLYGSGDDDPFDNKSTGYDAIFENPQFAGADNSYWVRQAVPLIGGGRVNLSTRNGVLANLRSSKDEGQSNFVNPGIWLFGAGVDLDVLPQLRVSMNWNSLWFDTTQVLEAARNQGSIAASIGQDVSASITYRPLMSQNIVVRTSYAKLFAGEGFVDLYGNDDPGYFLFNLVLTY